MLQNKFVPSESKHKLKCNLKSRNGTWSHMKKINLREKQLSNNAIKKKNIGIKQWHGQLIQSWSFFEKRKKKKHYICITNVNALHCFLKS